MKKGSLTTTILSLMLILILLSSGLASFAIISLSYSIGDSRVINASGSLRMQSYRLLFYANSGSKNTDEKIIEFENTLYSPELRASMKWPSSPEIGIQYQQVIDKWKQMKRYIQDENSRAYTNSIKDFVGIIDKMVLEIEHHAAFKIRVLVATQVIGLGIMLFIAFLAMRFMKRKIVTPLQQMMESANTISKGNFNVNMPKTDYIELSSLAGALDSTVHELSALYENLEQQVKDKTFEQTRLNNELTFLYENLVILHSAKLNVETIHNVLYKLSNYEQLCNVQLVIQQGDDEPEIISINSSWPKNKPTTRFPLKFEQQELGYLEVIHQQELNKPIFENIAIMLARSIVIHNTSEQRQHLALLEERAVIARELHDSLGQLLSFLKIQISLLNKGLDDDCKSPHVQEQLNELNNGVNIAYSQLRELLSTFRLTIKEPNLNNALNEMIKQLKNTTDIDITLDYHLPAQMLEARQHIHILQLTREATLNAIKHAQANKITIHCKKITDNMAEINISDNGIGLYHIKERDRHFGIGIMHERASQLSGKVDFTSNQSGGTSVVLTFPLLQEK